MSKDCGLVMGDIARDRALLSDCLPAYSLILVVFEVLNTMDTKFPHAVHWAFLNISASMDIETKFEIK
jgi:hypothetical protein